MKNHHETHTHGAGRRRSFSLGSDRNGPLVPTPFNSPLSQQQTRPSREITLRFYRWLTRRERSQMAANRLVIPRRSQRPTIFLWAEWPPPDKYHEPVIHFQKAPSEKRSVARPVANRIKTRPNLNRKKKNPSPVDSGRAWRCRSRFEFQIRKLSGK